MKAAGGNKRVRAPRWPKGFNPWRQVVERVVELLCEKANLRLQIQGAAAASGDDSEEVNLRIEAASGRVKQPLEVNADGTVEFGTILGAVPTIGGTPIGGSAALSLPSSGTSYIIARINATPVTTTLSGQTFTHGIVGVNVQLLVGGDPGSSGLVSSTGNYSFILATVVDGQPSNNGYGPIIGGVDDDLTGSGVAYLNLGYGGS